MRLLPGLRPGPRWGLTAPPPDPQLGKIVHPEKSVTYFFFPNDMPEYRTKTEDETQEKSDGSNIEGLGAGGIL